MSGNYTFYTNRVWVDHSDGRHILTLEKTAAGALQAAIPLFISLVGKIFWNFIRRLWFHIHFVRHRGAEQSRLTEEHYNILLHNSTGDLKTSLDAMKLWYTWQQISAHKVFRRFAPLALVPVFYWTVWTAASAISFFIWQDQITDLGLIRSSHCGFVEYNSTVYASNALTQSLLAETWVTQCYGAASPNPGACSLFPKRSLNFTSQRDVPCPFRSEDICISANSSSHEMTTGFIDSHYDLGINAPPEDRVLYRKTTVCSPIHTGPFTQDLPANQSDEVSEWPNDTILSRFMFGPVLDGDQLFTLEYNNAQILFNFGTELSTFYCTPENSTAPCSQTWLPNSTFFDRDDADISLFFLIQNRISYSTPTYDPWFKADIPYSTSNVTMYMPTYKVNALGCVDRHQICNPTRRDSSGCTAPMAYDQLNQALYSPALALNPAQVVTAGRIGISLVDVNTYVSVMARGASVLSVLNTIDGQVQYRALPVDQWRAEVEHWFSISLAKLQRETIDFAAGPPDQSLDSFVSHPTSRELDDQCKSQMIKIPSDHVNFNFDAIVAVAVVGSVMILVGLLCEPAISWYLRRTRGEGQLAWTTNGPFQLQHHVYAGMGIKGWRDTEEEIPTTMSSVPRLYTCSKPERAMSEKTV